MNINEQIVGNEEQVETTATEQEQTTTQPVEKNVVENKEVVAKTTTTPKTFTQEQVNKILRQRLEEANNRVYRRYGVNDKKELGELVSRAKIYNQLHDKYKELRELNNSLTKELAFSENNVNPERISDIEAYFKGKGIEFTRDSLKQEMATHPEWLRVVERSNKPKTTINQISTERGKTQPVNEKSEVAKLFGLERLI